MKKLFALLAIMLVPAVAMAGMSAVSDVDLEEVTGQTGITITMSTQINATAIAWGDDDGLTSYTNEGWVILSAIALPAISLSGVTIDAGTDGSGDSVLAIDMGTGNLIAGDLTIGAVIIGSAATSTSESIGEIRATGLTVKTGLIKISGHAAP